MLLLLGGGTFSFCARPASGVFALQPRFLVSLQMEHVHEASWVLGWLSAPVRLSFCVASGGVGRGGGAGNPVNDGLPWRWRTFDRLQSIQPHPLLWFSACVVWGTFSGCSELRLGSDSFGLGWFWLVDGAVCSGGGEADGGGGRASSVGRGASLS